MKKWLILLLATSTAIAAPNQDTLKTTAAIQNEILQHGEAYHNLEELTALGARLSGSENINRAIQWAIFKLKEIGFDSVTLQPMQATHWVRGDREIASAIASKGVLQLHITALGGSPGTHGITAPVIEVQSLDQVKELGKWVKGKIIFYNRPMDPALKNTFEAYSKAVDQRNGGPAVAADLGAVAVLVRSMTTLKDDDHPHTGMTHYHANKIPAAALSTRSANQLSAFLRSYPTTQVHLELSAQNEEPVTSYNIIAEYRGTSRPDELIDVGGHLDSWDLAQGAHDDGAGVVQSMEIIRAFKALKIRPERTIRVVLFMTEEAGGLGGDEYARQAKLKNEKHIAALESDEGGFAPQGFSGDIDALSEKLTSWKTYLAPTGAVKFRKEETETDIRPLKELGTICLGLNPDSTHYFDYHHSGLDVFANVKKDELHTGAAAMATMIYLLANDTT